MRPGPLFCDAGALTFSENVSMLSNHFGEIKKNGTPRISA